MEKFRYFAQPIESTRDQKLIMYELLLRKWDSSSGEWMTPTTFDLSSEQILSLLKEALEKLGDYPISINLTEAQFCDPEIITALTEFVDTRLQPHQLTIELVNSPSLKQIREASKHYRASGILIGIDDVGSDNHYKEVEPLLPYVNTLKFALQNLRPKDTFCLSHFIEKVKFWASKAEEKQLLFTFEGIENEADLKFALKSGITRGQGYFLSPPKDPKAFTN